MTAAAAGVGSVASLGAGGRGHHCHIVMTGGELIGVGAQAAGIFILQHCIPGLLGIRREPGGLQLGGAPIQHSAAQHLIGIHSGIEAVFGDGLLLDIKIQLQDHGIHIRLVDFAAGGTLGQGIQIVRRVGVEVVEVIHVGGIGVDKDLVVVQVEVQELDVLQTALADGLIVGADLVDGTIQLAVAVVIEAAGLIGSAGVVTAEHRKDIGVLGHHMIPDHHAEVIQIAVHAFLHMGVTVEAEDGFPVRIPGKHLIHPVDLVLIDVPAHVDDDKVLTVFADQVVVAVVVFIGAAKGGLVLHPILREPLIVFRPVVDTGVDIVVTGQNAVGHPGIVQDLHGLVSVFPHVDGVRVIHQVAGVDNVADLPAIPVLHHPLVHIDIVMIVALDIALGIADPGEGKIVILGGRFAIPAGIVAGDAVVDGVRIRQGGTVSALNDDLCLALLHMILHPEGGVGDGSGGIGLAHGQPTVGDYVAHEHTAGPGAVHPGGGAIPADHDLVIGSSISHVNGIAQVRHHTGDHLGLNPGGLDLFSLVEGHVGGRIGLCRQVQPGGGTGNVGGAGIGDAHGDTAHVEADLFGGGVTGHVGDSGFQGMASLPQRMGGDGTGSVDHFTVQQGHQGA